MRRLLLASALLLVPAVSFAQDTARMDHVVQSFVPGGFGGSVLVARGGDVVFRKGYGVDPGARTSVASITKQFTAAAILLLEERGRLKITDPVSRHLPGTPPAWADITLFHLLNHSAGFQGLATPPAARRPIEVPGGTLADFVKAAMERPLDAQPGDTFNYTNTGYFILGHLIQTLSGQTYDRFVQENFLTPLGMKDTRLEASPGLNPTPNAAGGFWSTTDDLLRWQIALYGGKVLSAASLRKMTTPFKGEYGLGIYIRPVNGRTAYTHGGGVPPFANLTYFPEAKMSVVVLGLPKGAGTPELAAFLGALAHGDSVTLASERKPITLPAEIVARYVGTYRTSGSDVVFALTGGRLGMRPPDGSEPIALDAASETTFYLPGSNMYIEFLVNRAGEASELIFHQGTRQDRARRVK